MHTSSGEYLTVSNRQEPAKILIVDDHPMVRDGLTMRISTQPDLSVCGDAATEDEAFLLVQRTSPDLVIVDISLKNGNGIPLIKKIKSHYPAVKMLVFSGYKESVYAERALRAGAQGYLNKQESSGELLEAIRALLAGQRYVSPEVTQRLVSQALGNAGETKPPFERLTTRELEIFRMVGEGLTSGAIANHLFLSTHTIDTHRENIKRKLDLKNAGELTRAAVQWVLENG
jgi:DNA-binding NarL/FixJ family response regulator